MAPETETTVATESKTNVARVLHVLGVILLLGAILFAGYRFFDNREILMYTLFDVETEEIKKSRESNLLHFLPGESRSAESVYNDFIALGQRELWLNLKKDPEYRFKFYFHKMGFGYAGIAALAGIVFIIIGKKKEN